MFVSRFIWNIALSKAIVIPLTVDSIIPPLSQSRVVKNTKSNDDPLRPLCWNLQNGYDDVDDGEDCGDDDGATCDYDECTAGAAYR